MNERDTALGHRGVENLAKLWKNQSERLKESLAFQRFTERLSREWAIETGIIERVYELDEGTTVLLLEQGFEAALIPHRSEEKTPEWIVEVLKDNRGALDFLFDFVAGRRDLNTSFLKELHVLFTRHQDFVDAIDPGGNKVRVRLVKGDWKRHPNNPMRPDGDIHEYCPPEHVASEIDRLLEMHREHAKKSIPVEVQAAWLHHRFTQIHPFQDGNGRLARGLATLIFLKNGWVQPVVDRRDRDTYLTTLASADQGDLEPLVRLYVRLEERVLARALAASMPSPEVLIEAAAERLRDPSGASEGERKGVHERVSSTTTYIQGRISNFVIHAQNRLPQNYLFRVSEGGDTTWDSELQKAVKGHLAPLRSLHRRWLHLTFGQGSAEMLVSVHAAGPLFRGVLVAVMSYRQKASESFEQLSDPFFFTLADGDPQIRDRLSPWLDETLSLATGRWLNSL